MDRPFQISEIHLIIGTLSYSIFDIKFQLLWQNTTVFQLIRSNLLCSKYEKKSFRLFFLFMYIQDF